ncbi:hypothetical protein B0H17DRAFT_1138435 [Mycena rosella]|uniref:Uncharacterized protein n=1 Tax=Mycena rosella TaxID=1033263 RepID=A0AAD7G9V1_MYCRO|nr:hypothetical protein B0H17DRAFT_1138435 [Mycena rosella]
MPKGKTETAPAHSQSKGTGSDQQNAKQATQAGVGGNGGVGAGPQFLTLPIGDTLGRKIEIPSMSLVEFCKEYKLGNDIFRILDEAELDVRGLIGANDLASKEIGLKFGHVAEVKWALKAMLLKCPAIEEVPIPRGLCQPKFKVTGGIGGDGGPGGKRGGDGGVGAGLRFNMKDLGRFSHIGGGVGGTGGAGGLPSGNNGASGKSPEGEEDSSPSYAENNEIAGSKGGRGGWSLCLGSEGGVGGAPIIPLEAIGGFQWIRGKLSCSRGADGVAAAEVGGTGGMGEAPKFPKLLAVIDQATRLQVQAKNMKLKDGEKLNEKLREFKFDIDQELLDRLHDHGFQSVGALFEIHDIDLDVAQFEPGNKLTLGRVLGEFLTEAKDARTHHVLGVRIISRRPSHTELGDQARPPGCGGSFQPRYQDMYAVALFESDSYTVVWWFKIWNFRFKAPVQPICFQLVAVTNAAYNLNGRIVIGRSSEPDAGGVVWQVFVRIPSPRTAE